MFKIEELLSLFPNEEIKKLLISSYYLAKEQNNDFANTVFSQLLLLKRLNPHIDIIFIPTKETSCFDYNEDKIYLNELYIPTFFHELTHLFSYHFAYFEMPNEFSYFKNKFLTEKDNTSLIIYLLDLCQKRRMQLLKKEINFENNELNSTHSPHISIIEDIEDIIDSIYDGKSSTIGLTTIRNNERLSNKSQKSAGHGCQYFSITKYQFEELLADYQTIKLICPNDELFLLLKKILGEEFVAFLDKRCQEISNSSLEEDKAIDKYI